MNSSKDIIDWEIESVRVTAFVSGLLDPSKLEHWLTDVCDNSPSQISKTPSSFLGVSRSSTGFLRVNWSANRLDISLVSEQTQIGKPIAPITELISLFTRFFDRIPEINDLAPVDRLALGLVLVSQVSNESEGLETLSRDFLNLTIPAGARDFLYRVNQPSESHTLEKVELNRLATWSVGKAQTIQFQINPDGSHEQQTLSESLPAIRLELDINTDQTAKLGLNSELMGKLLRELQEIALAISSARNRS